MATWPRLRPATNANCESVTRLVYTVLAEYGLRADPDCTDADLGDIEQSYIHRGGVFYVLEYEDGDIVGSYGLYPLAAVPHTAQDASTVAAGPRACPGERPTSSEGAGNHGGLPLHVPHTTPAACELRKMYLRRDHRGKGLGRQLLEHALAEARRLGFQQVTLETASVLTEAIRLYESYGFKPYNPDHLSPRCDQAYILELR